MTANPDATFQYMTGQLRPGHPALLDAFQQESDLAVVQSRPALDLPYGPDPRETFDFFASQRPWRGTLAYFHAGYWQSRDKSQFRFLATSFLAHGIDVAFVNYPLCPVVTLENLVEATRNSVATILGHAAGRGRGGNGLVASGHSAGGHIAVELALTGWPRQGREASPIKGVIALSGVYDLEPLRETPLNDRLRLDQRSARALSPLHRVRAGMPDALFAVGAAETSAFLEQNATMHAAWLAAGNQAAKLHVDAADHFSLLRAFERPGELMTRALALF